MPKKKITHLTNANGNKVPIEAVSKFDKDKERLVERFIRRRLKMAELLEKLNSDEVSDLQQFQSMREKEHGVKMGLRGNMQFSDYEMNRKVNLKTAYNIKLDDAATEACRIMREYLISDLGKNEQDKKAAERIGALISLVDKAFTPNRAGNLPQGRIYEVLDLNISAPEWQQARTLLQNSIHSYRGRSYVEVSTRKSRQHKFKPIILDLANYWPDGVTIE